MLKISQFLPPKRKPQIQPQINTEPQVETVQSSEPTKSKREPGFLDIFWDSATKPEVRGMPWEQYSRQFGKKYRRRNPNWYGRWITPSRMFNNIVGK